MKYSIIYDSKSGNTKMVADAIRASLSGDECLYCGGPHNYQFQECDLFFLGSWCDKGAFSDVMREKLPLFKSEKIAIFGTCGFGANQAYFDSVANNMKKQLDSTNQIIHSFLCQGKMPLSVRKRYEGMLNNEKMKEQATSLIENFDLALTHPSQEDMVNVKQFALKCKKDISLIK